jgi:hypothetical protein
MPNTTESVRLGIEVENDALPAKVREPHRPAVLVGQLEVWSLVALLDHAAILAIRQLDLRSVRRCEPSRVAWADGLAARRGRGAV